MSDSNGSFNDHPVYMGDKSKKRVKNPKMKSKFVK